ncbi:MAG TPA: LysR family transcriptional regulator, partial [Chloroflexota bacterium]|nr:LysR family transcriptional regulator [Chloroflexota bacterium]
MEFRQLACFQEVARQRHFTQAAKLLGISQPAASDQIKRLEEEIGARLLDRSGKRVALTQAGEIMLLHIHRVFDELERARAEVGEAESLGRGHVALGTTQTITSIMLPEILGRFRSRFQETTLSVSALGNSELFRQISSGELDLAIVSLIRNDREIETEELFVEEIVLLIRQDHWLASRDTVSPGDLRDVPMVLTHRGFALRQYLEDACQQFGFTPTAAVEIGQTEMTVGMVLAGFGPAVLPRVAVDADRHPGIEVRRFVNPRLCRRVGIIYRKGRY